MSSPHTYTPLTPPSLPSSITQFFTAFYALSDTSTPVPQAHSEWVSSFTPTATLVMGSRRGVGHSEIRALREGMWEHVAARLHTPAKIFPFVSTEKEAEVMLYGTVAYTLKDGRKAEVDWAGRAELVRDDKEEWKMGFYQVYLDTVAVQNAK